MSDFSPMDPAEAAFAVLDELKRQRSEGVRSLYLEESTLLDLESLLSGPEQNTALARPPALTSPTKAPIAENFPKVTISQDVTVIAETEKPTSPVAVNSVFAQPPVVELPLGAKQEQWDWLKDRVLGCEVCQGQLNPDSQVVFGVGDLDADLFFCGEAPGAEEEMAGEPFVGPAGDLLDRIISAMDLSRESVYIGNVVNFRPRHERAYGNRPPTSEEMSFCLPYLKAQLEIVKPKVVVALGKTATDGLLGADPQRRLGQMRGTWHEYSNIPMMVTYHPSYLLHNPSKSSKRKVWEDMLLVMDKLELPISEKQRGFFQ
jgi:uracil-DNA glycosylase family 4